MPPCPIMVKVYIYILMKSFYALLVNRNLFLRTNGYYGHPGNHIDPGGGQWHEPVAGAGGDGGQGQVPREGSPSQMGHHYQHIQTQAQGMYPCKMQGGPPR